MKQVLLGAALCGAALAFAGAANANADAAADTTAAASYDFLYGSTDALVLGPTGIPTPSANYISHGIDLYLDPLGYQGTVASSEALTLPNSYDFLESVPQGEKVLIDAVLAAYNAGEMDCDSSGACSDPLTIFTYSQSSLIAAYAQDDLVKAGVPEDALRFVMLGATPSAVPTDMYPTEVFNIAGDIYTTHSLTQSWIDLLFGNTSWEDVLYGLAVHNAYLGLTADQIDSATSVTDGLTTFNEIPELSFPELFQALFSSFFAV
ncbi:PE-PPE domain-containing protein [Mycolicibacter terrae]|uniref:PE family protein n=2 Tax=Mycolicibacter TaxID=1073531 RepID=A0A1A2NSC3_MYCSD|nr:MULTISPECIES: PE-PPE domain-containing protein [Mycolicibacter]OBH17976.1 PE family protein [Mycolicibacter sinensis]OBI29540.1 PE family protein [Mycolicibacter sinensis]RRR46848.1 PE-PPE domain-containing protein [Mycolicibacter terrae]